MINHHEILDCHAHIGHYDRGEVVLSESSDLVQEMDRAGVKQACISAFLSIGPDAELGNDVVAEAVRRYPDRLIGYAVINPNRPENAERELSRCFDTLGFKAIKLHPAAHQYAIDDVGYRTTLEFAAQRQCVILSHEWGSPKVLETLSLAYPSIKFIVAHTGFWNGRGECPYADVVRRRANVFVELAYSNVYYDALERLVMQIGSDRVLFGSDCILMDLAYQLGRVVYSRLSNEDKRLILGENMRRLLGK